MTTIIESTAALTGTFTQRGIFTGARKILPIAISGVVFDAIVGMLARQAGFTFAETLMLHAFVFAGTAQLAALALWVTPVPVVAILVSTAIVNARYLLMSATIHPWMARLPAHKTYGSLFFLTDETWALAQTEYSGADPDAGFLLGSGGFMWALGFIGITLGYVGGALLGDPAQWGLDFLFTAVLIALLVSLWKGRTSVLPWLVAAAVAIVASRLLPGNWYIVLGGLAGSLVGAFRDAR